MARSEQNQTFIERYWPEAGALSGVFSMALSGMVLVDPSENIPVSATVWEAGIFVAGFVLAAAGFEGMNGRDRMDV